MDRVGVVELSLSGRGPKRGFIFDDHRMALPCWALAMRGEAPALLLTLDRHFDLVAPRPWSLTPDLKDGRAMDDFARYQLDTRNYDHVIAAMELGIVSDVIAVARNHPQEAIKDLVWQDSRGQAHRILRAPRVSKLSEGFGLKGRGGPSQQAEEWMVNASSMLLDFDLDCFTSPSDAEPLNIVPWPASLIEDYLLPEGSELFWDRVLQKTSALTFAKEPVHCGGIIESNRLFETACRVIFQKLLRADLP